MKKKILFLLSLVLSGQLFSQNYADTSSAPFFGVYGQLNYWNYTGDDFLDDFNSELGWGLGAFYNVPFGENFALNNEVGFRLVGASYDVSNDEVKWNMGYIIIGIIGQYHFNNNPSHLYVELGPQFNFLISAKQKYGDQEDDIKDDFKSTEFGVPVGLGYQFSRKIRLGVRYYFGISNFAEQDDDFEIKHRGAQLNVRYCFR